jgi:hypothetical protein
MREKNKRKTTIENRKNSNDVENCNHNAHLPTGFKAHYYVSMHVGVSGKLASFITAGNISLDTRTHISNAKRKNYDKPSLTPRRRLGRFFEKVCSAFRV